MTTKRLPQLDDPVFLTDGGLETTLVYDDGLDLPDFAAFVLLDDPAGRAALVRYFDHYLEIAARRGLGIVLETPTWRANPDWAARLGYDAKQLVAVNQDAVDLVVEARNRWAGRTGPIVVSGCFGPRGDGYVAGAQMTVEEARAYHALQAQTFAGAGVDLVTAITMTYAAEATGIALAARDAGLPVVISFTVETDGALPSGTALADAIRIVDEATDAYPAYYMVNCAHPVHLAGVLDGDVPWLARIGGLRANASTSSHAELDVATELDAGDPADLAARYQALRDILPGLRVLGGCCGTTHVHVDAIAEACLAPAPI